MVSPLAVLELVEQHAVIHFLHSEGDKSGKRV